MPKNTEQRPSYAILLAAACVLNFTSVNKKNVELTKRRVVQNGNGTKRCSGM